MDSNIGENGNEELTQLTKDPEMEVTEQKAAEQQCEESEKLSEVLSNTEEERVEANVSVTTSSSELTIEEKMEIDSRSIYIGNIDYGATTEDLMKHFSGCGVVNRVVILKDKYTGHPKGFAFLEFAEKEAVTTSLELDTSLFCGRQIKVMQKRTNTPGISSTNRPPRGGRFRRNPGMFNNGGYRPFRRRA